jgi:hypothetical protein
MGKAVRARGDFDDVRLYLGGLDRSDLHAKRIESLAQARGLVTKPAVKHVTSLKAV